MKFILNICLTSAIVLFVSNFLVAQSSQEKCVQKRSEFPALRGLKLKMAQSDVMKIYPLASARKPKDEIGVIVMSVIKDQIVDNELKQNLKGITMEFMDDNLELISIKYDDSVKFGSLSKFVESLSGSLNIPVKHWVTKSEGVYAAAVCDDFMLLAFMLGDEPSLMLQVRDYGEITVRRKKDIEEKRSKSFKP